MLGVGASWGVAGNEPSHSQERKDQVCVVMDVRGFVPEYCLCRSLYSPGVIVVLVRWVWSPCPPRFGADERAESGELVGSRKLRRV